jgi:hypothetical protein
VLPLSQRPWAAVLPLSQKPWAAVKVWLCIFVQASVLIVRKHVKAVLQAEGIFAVLLNFLV